ncbi:MAG: extracellular solute-binding protein, partial [Bacteroidota bacterium]
MKKSLFLLLTIVIVISIFSIPSFAARNETITIWAMGVEGLTLGKIIPKFEAANPGIKVKLQQVPWGSAHEKLITSIAGGSVPDISQMGTTWMPEFMAAGVLEVLDPYLKKS